MNIKLLFEALEQLADEKGVNKETLLFQIGEGIKKGFEAINGENTSDCLDVEYDLNEKTFNVYNRKVVVEEVMNEIKEISLEEAEQYDPDAELGDVMRFEVDPKDFDRVAASTVKSMMRQAIRTEESKTVKTFFEGRKHTVVSGKVISIKPNGYSVNLGKDVVFLSKNDTIPGESFYLNETIRVYIADVREEERIDNRKGEKRGHRKSLFVSVSRIKPGMLRALLQESIPEIQDGTVELVSVSREPGVRAKIAVFSHDENVDPVGSCIGVNNSRLEPISAELKKEKIDVILWNENPASYVTNALAPAHIKAVIADEEQKTALAIVDEDQLSLAIGLKGINAKLAARLTGYKIDIKTENDARAQGLLEEYDAQMAAYAEGLLAPDNDEPAEEE